MVDKPGGGYRKKELTFSMLGTVVLAGLAAAQPAKAASEDVAAALKGLEEKWVQAQLKGDTDALGAVLADGFVSTTMKSGALKVQSSKVDDMRVMVFGDAARAVGRWRGKGTEKGKAFDDDERFTDTWIKQDGQ